ncbi:MAG: PEP-CTERM sorting domain-containing protein [Phycisphaerae bacterium]|nr:PEP-CTERM sorting domain-containing protein [Phycisphaerae bacterium]
MKKVILCLLVLLVATVTANAAVTGPATDTITATATNWNGTLTLPQFNPDAHKVNPTDTVTLNFVTLTLDSGVSGVIKFENLDSTAATVTGNLAANVTVTGAGTTLMAAPTASKTETIAGYDGNLDFGGTSGRTYTDLSGSDSATTDLTTDAEKAPFIGLGTIDFAVSAIGASNGAGPGNLMLGFNTIADATATVTYNYTSIPVPEPMTMSLLALGGLAVVRRRK